MIHDEIAGGGSWSAGWEKLALKNSDLGQVFRDLAVKHGRNVAGHTSDIEALGIGIDFELASVTFYERKLVEAQLEQHINYLSALHETTLGLISRLDLSELLQTIVNRAGQLLGTPHGFIFLLEPGGGRAGAKGG